MKNFLLLVTLISTFNSFGQKKDTNANKAQSARPLIAENSFEIDLNNNKLKIYLLGGIASRVTKEDIAFTSKYNTKFHDFGCLMPLNYSYFEKYNNLVFNYLKVKYGNDWEMELNLTAFGFEKWKNKNS